MSKLPQVVNAVIRRQRLIPDGGGCVVGVSGGLDSVALLHVLWGLAARHGWTLQVAHFNHRLRGRASDGDERFVRKLVGRLGLPVTCGSGDVRRNARARGCSLEVAARELRHAFLAAVACETGARRVALAHHANDQTETFLIRLLRGAGGEGLGGMRLASPSPADSAVTLIRPLLETTRAEIEAYARAGHLTWREDASNREERPLRNWLRRQILPLLEARTEGAIHRLVSRAAQTVGADSQYSRFQARRWLNARRRRPSFARLHPAVQRQVIAEQLVALGIEPAYEAIERLRLLEDEPMATPAGTLSRNASGELTPVTAVARSFDQAEIELDLRPKAGTAEFARVRLEWRRRAVPRGWAVPPQVPGREFMDARCIGPRLILRHWRPGDRFQPIGLAKAAKLQDLFTNAKIPRDVRRLAVLACRPEGKIVWVEGIRLGDAVKVRPATRLILEWRWQRREE